jgi:hypothetical protein
MIPFFEIFNWWLIYTFGLTLTLCFFLFLWLLRKVSDKFWINFSFFVNRIFWFFLSTFLFSRLFYIIWRWEDFKFINNFLEFFIMTDYNFSLIWGIFGFLLVLFLSTRSFKIQSWKYIDATVITFLFVAIFWFIWAFLGGQIYWTETTYWIEVVYNHSFSPVVSGIPVFPLALVYSWVCFVLFSLLYMLSDFVKVRWLLWYIGMILFFSGILILDNFNWKADLFVQKYAISFNQIWAIFFILFAFFKLYMISKDSSKQNDIII